MNRPLDFEPEQAEPARFTVEEFVRMAELGAFDDMKVELDHGEIIRVTPPYSDHSIVQGQLIGKLYEVLKGSGLQVAGEVGVEFGRDTVRVIDVGVLQSGVEPGRLVKPEEVRLAVEVAIASLERDTSLKLRDYASGGIADYWVVDVRGRRVHVYRDPVGAAYRSFDEIPFGAPLTVPGATTGIVLD